MKAAAAVRSLCARSLFIVIISCSYPVVAQTTVGIQPFGSYQGTIDQINLGDLSLHIDIPLFEHKARGRNMALSVHLIYDNAYFSGDGNDWGWRVTAVSATGGGVGGNYTTYNCPPRTDGQNPGTYQQWTYNFVDSTGYQHAFSGTSIYSGCDAIPNPNPTTTLNVFATDGSGYHLVATGYDALVTDPWGTQFHTYIPGTPVVTDANGNVGYAGSLKDTSNVTVSITGGYYIYQGSTITSRSPLVVKYTDSSGNPQQIVVTYKLYSLGNVAGFGMVDTVTFPDGSAYHFTYQTSVPAVPPPLLGYPPLLGSIQLPGGGLVSYQTTYTPVGSYGCQATKTIRTTSDGTTTYSSAGPTTRTCYGNISTTINKADGSSEKVYFGPASAGLETAHYWYNNSGSTVKSTMRCYDGQSGDCTSSSISLPITQISTTTTLDNGQSSKQVEFLNASGLQTELDEYDYGASSPTRKTITAYASLANNITAQSSSVTVTDGSGNQVNKTTYGYDEYSLASSGVSGLASISGSRGNRTSEHDWNNVSGTTLDSHWCYDDAGQVVASQDPAASSHGQSCSSGQLTSYGHDSTDTYVTLVTPSTPSSGVSLPTSATYDGNTGLITSTTDPNGIKTKYSYDDMLRISEIDILNSSGGTVAETTYGYSPTQLSVHQHQSASVSSDTETQYDGYGRQSRVAVYNGQAANGWYQVDTCYNAVGEVGFQSYSYQSTGFVGSNGSPTPKVCSGTGDAYAYDTLARPLSVTHGDNTAINYSYTGRATKTTDENGVQRITQLDGLGRVTAVCEISSNSSMPSSGSPTSCGMDIPGTGFSTTYGYNLANRTTTMTQGAQTRTFQTDSLGRAVSTQEPERGQTTYTYVYSSSTGLGLTVTRKRPKANQTNTSVLTTTTAQFDSMGRAVSISYDDGTPTRTYTYDVGSLSGATLQNPKGRMVQQISGTNAGQLFSYDPIGNIIWMNQCTPWKCSSGGYTTSYSYDWAGNMLTAGNGDGVTISYNNYTPANEVGSITSSQNDSTHPGTLVSQVAYGPNGPLTYTLGNGLQTSFLYDILGRPQGQWLCQGTNQNGCNGGTQIYGNTTSWKGVRNLGLCDTVLNRCESFGYDEFNRLTSQNVNSGTVQNFSYGYDRWGNRWAQTLTSGTGPQSSLSFNTATNRISSTGFGYDAAGNQTSDTFHTYTYDAEGNVTQVDPNGATAKFTYDALNRRIRVDQSARNTSAEYVLNPKGQRVAYWSQILGYEVQGHTYWGSTPIEYYQSNQAHFQHQDYLGTERMTTLYNGSVEGSFVSLPFGDGFTISGSDSDYYHFATLDHDYTSNTDHAKFRQYSNEQGRWMSPDPYSGSYDFTNPQSLNRYSYVFNNPLSFIDPAGEVPCNGIAIITIVVTPSGVDAPQQSPDDCPDSLSQLQYDQYFFQMVNHPILGNPLQTSSPSVQTQIASIPTPTNVLTIGAYHGSVSECSQQAGIAAGEDLVGVSMLPDTAPDDWKWSSAKFGFVYVGAGQGESLLSASTPFDAAERTADFVEGSQWAQGEIRQFFRSEGVKVSMKHVAKDAAFVGKWAGRGSKVLAAYSAYERYQKCRGY